MSNYENFYTGGYSSLNSNYGNYIGFRLKAANLGFPGGSQTANQLGETVNAIKQGTKTFEVTAVAPEIAEQIPKEHFKEIAALTKLTGVKASVHAPILDPAGFGERGWEGETARKNSEQRMIDFVDKAHDLDPTGNIPIVFHSSAGIPGNEYIPDKDKKAGEKGRFKENMIIAINQETKEMIPIKAEVEYDPREKGLKKERVPSEYLKEVNERVWANQIYDLAYMKRYAEDIVKSSYLAGAEFMNKPLTEESQLTKEEKAIYSHLKDAEPMIQNMEVKFRNLFDNAYKYSNESQRAKLKELSDDYRNTINKKEIKTLANPSIRLTALDEAQKKLNDITKDRENIPEIYVPVEGFAIKKAAETFGNVAFESYKKFKGNAPVIAIENMMPGMAFSRPEEFTELLNNSRKQFVKKAMDSGMSQEEAESKANKTIGATWDVGHLNMMRKQGFKEEDVVDATKKVAKYVKHIHLTDNFGYSDSHLAPGMGNVPTKKILEELEKTGRLDEMRKIVEAPAFVQHFKKSPLPYTLSALGTPVYEGGPYFNQIDSMQGGYFGSPMAYLPEKHFSMYGAGFSGLPMELGGQIPGTQSRFSGTPNA